MAKSEVYSWRVAPDVKGRLEDAARRERRSVADLLEEIVTSHLKMRGGSDDEQRRLHARVAGFAGCLNGPNPDRSTTVRERVRARLGSRSSNAR